MVFAHSSQAEKSERQKTDIGVTGKRREVIYMQRGATRIAQAHEKDLVGVVLDRMANILLPGRAVGDSMVLEDRVANILLAGRAVGDSMEVLEDRVANILLPGRAVGDSIVRIFITRLNRR